MTEPVFIVSSGRSGSALIDKVLKNFSEIESHHEYLCTHVQHLAMRKYFKLDGKQATIAKLKKIYAPAIEFSKKRLFIDSSNKLSWVIPELREIFPNAKFIFFIRNGKNVVSSFYNKLFDEAYDDVSVGRIIDFLKSRDYNLEPPPEKKYEKIIKIKCENSSRDPRVDEGWGGRLLHGVLLFPFSFFFTRRHYSRPQKKKELILICLDQSADHLGN